MYFVKNDILTLNSDAHGIDFDIAIGNTRFLSDKSAECYYTDMKGKIHLFSELDCEFSEINETDCCGFIYDYKDFSLKLLIKAQTSEVEFVFSPKESCYDINEVYWPTPVLREYSESGYAVLPIMQGMMIEDSEQQEAQNVLDGYYTSRDFTMPWWGQVSDCGSYMALVETPYDSKYLYNHKVGKSSSIRIVWRTSLGEIGYDRKLCITFYEEKRDYVQFCKTYRTLLEKRGKISTLSDKIKKNPILEKMIGRSVLTPSTIHYKIEPESDYYNAEEPEKNTCTNSFESIAAELEKCYEKGVRDAYVHIDGWGLGGYDNLHPRIYPINPEAGGEEGLKLVAEVCKKQNYLLAYHDQYRDYFLKSPDYDANKGVMHADGTVSSTEDIIWYGGIESQLCATQVKQFIERNYKQLDNNGLKPDGVYIDVFSASILDECFNPEHPMTREECVKYRKECFNYIRENGMIISSEELMGEFADTLDLVHHSPYIHAFFEHVNMKPFGVHIPLLNLVFHDCVIIPWAMGKDVWGLPDGESGFLNCLLNGDVASLMTFSPDEVFLNAKMTERLHRQVALAQMVSHEFTEGKHKQKTVFTTGTEVYIDTKQNTFLIKWADGSITEGSVN